MIIIYFYYNNDNKKLIKESLFGIWTATDARCKEMLIDLMIFGIGKKINYNSFNIFIFSKSKNKVILAENTLMSINNIIIKDNKIYADLIFDTIENKNFPLNQKLIYDIKINKLILYKDNDMYCELYKNSYYSDIVDTENKDLLSIIK